MTIRRIEKENKVVEQMLAGRVLSRKTAIRTLNMAEVKPFGVIRDIDLKTCYSTLCVGHCWSGAMCLSTGVT